nr:hypothetical protein [Oscillatoria sp. PCC 10802]
MGAGSLAWGVSEHGLECRIGKADETVLVGNADATGHVFQDSLPELQHFGSLLAGGCFANQPAQSSEVALAVAQGASTELSVKSGDLRGLVIPQALAPGSLSWILTALTDWGLAEKPGVRHSCLTPLSRYPCSRRLLLAVGVLARGSCCDGTSNVKVALSGCRARFPPAHSACQSDSPQSGVLKSSLEKSSATLFKLGACWL